MVLASSASIELESSSARVTSTTFQKRSLQCLNGYFFSLVKSHILGYDGVWNSSFWSEGVYKAPKLTKFGLKFCSLRFGLAAQGVYTRGATDTPSRRESKPLAAPRVQTPGNKILDQLFSV